MHYEVYTPQFWTYYYSGDPEPPEYTCDWAEVEAPTKRQAKVLAVRKWRQEGAEWVADQNSDKASPFTGLKVTTLLCAHGVCHCTTFKDCPLTGDCKICYEEVVGEPYPED